MMKNDHALRRILYYMMIVAEGLHVLTHKTGHYATQEACKVGALISLRALSTFLTDDPSLKKDGSRKFPDDTFITDFGFQHRKGLDTNVRERINKVLAHAVNKKYPVFKDLEEIVQFAQPVLKECAEFVAESLRERKAKLTGNAPKYLRRIKDLMPKLPLPQVT